jgi:MFS family permease
MLNKISRKEMDDLTKVGGMMPTKKDRIRTLVDSRYAWYVLGMLCLVYIFNQMDRYILSILAEGVKKTFSMSDSQFGFLTGTAFAMFYALFGYPIARLADRWSRVKLLAIGLSLWSIMTVMSGLSSSLGQMSTFRVGVGIGEATASPVGFSLISDWFSKAKRATTLGIFSAGLNIGIGLSLLLGGLIESHWNLAHPIVKPFGLEGWRVTFLAFGLPGILLAVWVLTLREPARGQSDGVVRPVESRIWVGFFRDLCGILPPLTLYDAARRGWVAFGSNIAAALLSAISAGILIRLTGDWMQWTAIGFGYYAAFSASQSLRHSDRATFALTWGTPTFLLAMIGFGAASMVAIVIGFWMAPLAVRTFAMDRGTVGTIIGSITAVGGSTGMIIGGRLSDMFLKRTPLGRIGVSIASSLIPMPFIIVMCLTHNATVFFLCFVPVSVIGTAWVGAGAATIQDLVLPRMRATATNVYFLVATLVGTGLGPYMVGKISVATHSLSSGLLYTLIFGGLVAAGALWMCGRGIEQAEASKWRRAMAAGEPAVTHSLEE